MWKKSLWLSAFSPQKNLMTIAWIEAEEGEAEGGKEGDERYTLTFWLLNSEAEDSD